jgi:hypothetical protein
MGEETWDRVLGDIFAALDRDAAAEGQLIAITPLLSNDQILRAWAYLVHDDALRWRARGALAHEALQRVAGRAERDGRGTEAVRQLASTLGVAAGRVYHLAQIHAVVAGGDGGKGKGTPLPMEAGMSPSPSPSPSPCPPTLVARDADTGRPVGDYVPIKGPAMDRTLSLL